MPTIADAEALALALPEVTVGERWGNRTWLVRGKAFAWERPLSKADIKRYGDEQPPGGELLAVRVADLHEVEAVLAEHRKGFFTIAHFADYPAVMIELKLVGKRHLREAITDAWLAMAPPALAAELTGHVKRARGTAPSRGRAGP